MRATTNTLIALMAITMASSAALGAECRHDDATATADAKAMLARAKEAEKINADAVMNLFYLSFAEDFRIREFPVGTAPDKRPEFRPLNGLQLARVQMLEVKAMQKALPDFAQKIECFGASGDTLEALRIWTGSLPDKTQLRLALLHRFTVKGNKLVSLEAEATRTPETSAHLRKIFQDSGVFAQAAPQAK